MTARRTNAAVFAALIVTIAFAHAADTRTQATSPNITPADLEHRLRVLAHDSMLGRQTGSRSLRLAVLSVAAELQRLGALPLGQNRTFMQRVPLEHASLDTSRSKLGAGVRSLAYGVDFLPVPGFPGFHFPRRASEALAPIMYGGRLGTSTAVDSALVKKSFVVFHLPVRPNGQPDYQVWNYTHLLGKYHLATGIGVIGLELLPLSVRRRLAEPRLDYDDDARDDPKVPPVYLLTRSAARFYLGDQIDAPAAMLPVLGARAGPASLVSHAFHMNTAALSAPAENVVAVIAGSDREMRSEYVVLSAHLDHLGVAAAADRVDADSVFNGADDGGTGSAALMEIAELIAAMPVKPKRSMLFLWTTAEEHAAIGSNWFLDHPTVPRESIVANINVDMIGRGNDRDIPGGGKNYLQLVGSRRRSVELGTWVEEVNERRTTPCQLDYRFDSDAFRAQYLCVGDHASFFKRGIPSVFVSTGVNGDYHRVTDDVDNIDFAKYARVTQFVADLAIDLANRPARPRVDQARTADNC
jgi:hypothetical protein